VMVNGDSGDGEQRFRRMLNTFRSSLERVFTMSGTGVHHGLEQVFTMSGTGVHHGLEQVLTMDWNGTVLRARR